MSPEFRSWVANLNNERIVNLADDIDNLRTMIKIISHADIFFAPSTGPLHIADALNIKTIGIHCRRNVSSANHQGILNDVSINLEVPEDYCNSFCSQDKQKCAIQTGLNEENVIGAINKLLAIK